MARKNRPAVGYVGLGVVMILLSIFIPSRKKEVQEGFVHYDLNSGDSVVYVVDKESVQRIGRCVSFQTKRGKSMNLCDNYRTITISK